MTTMLRRLQRVWVARAACIVLWVVLLAHGCTKPAQPAAVPVPPDILAVVQAEAERKGGIDTLTSLAERGDLSTRALALRGLGRTGGSRAVAVLLRALTDPEARLREQAAWGLGVAGAAEAEAELIALFRRERDIAVRAAALGALGRLGNAGTLAVLTEALADPALAEHAALALVSMGRRQHALSDDARVSLAQVARSGDARARFAAAAALMREYQPQPHPAVIPALKHLTSDPDPEIRTMAIAGLAQRRSGQEEHVDLFIRALADGDFRVRMVSASALGGAGNDAQAALTIALLKEWVLLGQEGFINPRIHVLTEGLRALGTGMDHDPSWKAVSMLRERAQDVLQKRVSVTPSDDAVLAASTIDCLTAAVFAGEKGPDELLACGGPEDSGMPVHERRRLVADALVRRRFDSPAKRWNILNSLFAHSDGRVRAAAMSALAEVGGELLTESIEETKTLSSRAESVASLVTRALSDSAVEVVGTAVEEVAQLVQTPGIPPTLADTLRQALLARSQKAMGNIELEITLLGALTNAGVTDARPLCDKAWTSANAAVRAVARTCLQKLGGRNEDPGPGTPSGLAVKPPVDPATVIGARVTLTIVTTKGEIRVELDPEAAPWHVASLAMLAERGFYRDLLWHRVVPGFVVQGGDPGGSGWGGPGFEIPAEPSAGTFDRGAVGIADAGMDTGGSQWFIMHARAPRLEGRYTIVGRVTAGQAVAESLIVGDRIVSATVEIARPRR